MVFKLPVSVQPYFTSLQKGQGGRKDVPVVRAQASGLGSPLCRLSLVRLAPK